MLSVTCFQQSLQETTTTTTTTATALILRDNEEQSVIVEARQISGKIQKELPDKYDSRKDTDSGKK